MTYEKACTLGFKGTEEDFNKMAVDIIKIINAKCDAISPSLDILKNLFLVLKS